MAPSPIPAAVSEGKSMVQDDLGPFARVPTSSLDLPRATMTEVADRTQQQGRFSSCCCRRPAVKEHGDAAGAGGDLGPTTSNRQAPKLADTATSGSMRLSDRFSGSRKWGTFKRLGSHAYSDVEWFDALSKSDDVTSGDQGHRLTELDQMPTELSTTGPWVPDPPLLFGVPNMHFLPFPLDVSRFNGYWERDNDRTTPPPQPIDVLLKVNFITQKVHNSIPGIMLEETDKELRVVVKPSFVPPGMPRYIENFDNLQPVETNWTLRRDLRAGRSYGRMYMTTDGTLILRVETKPLLSNVVDVITEEYMRLEEGGSVIVVRQCCLQVSSGKHATQYLVGRRREHPPKGF